MKYRLLLLSATLIWGSTFVIMKDMTAQLPPGLILALRFSVASLIMLGAFASKRSLFLTKEHIFGGVACGLALFAAYYAQTIGITDTTPGKNAFLTSTYCIFVPFLAWAINRKKPTGYNLVAAALCLIGVGLICLQSSLSLSFGDSMTLICALLFGLHITLVAKFSRHCNIYVLTLWQFITVGLGSWVVALAFEPPIDLASVSVGSWLWLGYLSIFATTLALLIQNVAQAHLSAASAALLLATEAVFGVGFSVLLGYESLTVPMILGFCLVFLSIYISEVLSLRMKDKKLL